MAQIPPGFAQVSLPLTNAALTRPAYVVWGVEVVEGSAFPEDLADRCQQAWLDGFRGGMDSNVTIGPARVAIGQDGGDPIVGTASTTVNGQASIDSLPPANAVIIRKNTNLGGRRGRGFMYIPWYITRASVSEGGVIESSAVTSRTVAANNFLTASAEDDLPVVLLHSEGISAIPEPTPVNNMSCLPIISHQVRRQTR